MSRVRRIRSDWTLLFLAYAVLVSAADAFLLERTQTFFTAGFNAGYARGLPQLVAFFAASALADLWLIVGIWALVLPVLGRLPGTEAQRLASAWFLALSVPLGIDFVRYRVGLVLGEVAQIPILLDVSAGALRILVSEAAIQAGPLLFVLALAGLASAGCVYVLGRVVRATGRWADAKSPRTRSLWRAFALLSVLAVASSIFTAQVAPNLYAGLAQKSAGWLLDRIVQRATDVDFDGFGLLSVPADPAPFDGDRHAFALDLPGNGVDENGLGGDLPRGARAPAIATLPASTPGGRRPDLLLIYLESFRADLLLRQRAGRAVTPFLAELAREGATTEHAYVHSPYTLWSRAQLFGGAVVPRYGQRTLVDDFKARGYTVALFSGQDDSFGRSPELTGVARADVVYDASEDVARRTSRSASAASLQVSAATVLERVRGFLRGVDAARPLFLYVNLVDTHFPYTHDEVPDLLGVAPLARADIHPGNVEAVRAAYENTAAYVDAAAREVVADFRSAIGGRDHAILVVADHGQGFYERGFLGHGQALTDDQTRTPFVLWGVGGEWPEPLGMADVRGLLVRNLFAESGAGPRRARFVGDPERRVLHFMARVDSPRLIGLRSLEGLTSYDLTSARLELYDDEDAPRTVTDAERTAAFEELVHAWEATRIAHSE